MTCEVRDRLVRRPGRRGGDADAADRQHHLHVALGLVQALLPLEVVVHDPAGEADGAFDLEAEVGDLLAEVLEVAALLDEVLQLADPRLDGVVAGLGGQLGLLVDRDFLSADGAGVERVAERLGRFGGRGGRGQGGGAATAAGGHGEHVAT